MALMGNNVWNSLKIGGMGFFPEVCHAPDGSWSLGRTDVAGFHRRTCPDGDWDPCVVYDATNTKFPSSIFLDYTPAESTELGNGCYAIAIGPDSTTAYAAFRGYILKTTDKGLTWANTGFTRQALTSNDQSGAIRLVSDKLMVDPVNKDVVYIFTQLHGLYRTLDGGSTWSAVASVPTPANPASGNNYGLITFDAASSNSSTPTRKSRIIVSVWGTGVYESTNGGTSFSAISSSPTMVTCFEWDSTGRLYACSGTYQNPANTISYRTTGAWTSVTPPGGVGACYLDIDPADYNKWTMTDSAVFYRSLDRGATWAGPWGGIASRCVANKRPILAERLNSNFAAGGAADFGRPRRHPTNGRLSTQTGFGHTYIVPANFPTNPLDASNKLTFFEDNAGVEELVGQSGGFFPNGTGILLTHDDPMTVITDPAAVATIQPIKTGLYQGLSVDYAIDDPLWGAALLRKGGHKDSITTDGGLTWTQFAANCPGGDGGALAVGNKLNIVVAAGSNSWPQYTTNGGTSWADCTFAGITKITSGETGFGFGGTEIIRHIVTADKNNPGTFYIYAYGPSGTPNLQGLWKSTNSGANWSRINTTTIVDPLTVGYHVILKMADDGTLYISPGDVGGDYESDSGTAYMYRSVDGGVNWTQIAGVTEAYCMCVGAKTRGGTYNPLYVYGWVSGVKGWFMSLDRGATWISKAKYYAYDNTRSIAADPKTFGRYLAIFNGQGGAFGRFQKTVRLS